MTEDEQQPGVRRSRAAAASGSADRPDAIDQWQDLYQRFRSPLERYFRKRVRQQGEVDDLVQEVFARLVARSADLQLQKPEAYLFQVAANLLRDRARRDIFRKSASGRYAEENEDSFEAITPERVLLGKQRIAELKMALAELPEKARFVFLLHRFEGMKYREIAQHLGISVSSVEKHMMNAIAHISRRLERNR